MGNMPYACYPIVYFCTNDLGIFFALKNEKTTGVFIVLISDSTVSVIVRSDVLVQTQPDFMCQHTEVRCHR